MHDSNEDGLAGTLRGLAEACGYTLVDPHAVIIPPLSKKICEAFEINPLERIASGALLLMLLHTSKFDFLVFNGQPAVAENC
jgi:hydrogenase expression/formation protein HypE